MANELNKDEVDALYKLKNNKNITNIEIARSLNYAHSTVNGFFNKYIGSEKLFLNIKLFIENQETRLIKIKQEKYGLIEVDNTENDIVIISNKQKNEFNLIQIERSNIKKLINILKKELL